ncbi:hypothetical protein ACQKNX_04390 [Lysinibacillus sp. NPDC093712]|uniref:hypothetical protein n=1 Tax=Lysinibacillus sp. NPDC093712 TaxID=3390579 RepID=UPI003D032BD9
MKKSYKIILGILIPIIILFVTTSLLTRDSTFNKEVIDRLDIEQINEIEIIRASDEKTITIKDAAKISEIMQLFENKEIRKVFFAKSDFKEAYWLTLQINDNREVGIRLDDATHLFVYLYEENYMKDYKLLDKLDTKYIEELFLE